MSCSKIPCVPFPEMDDRRRKLFNAFENRFGCEPEFYVRVPGRVNLIGEHIDYCGYGVCPMALQQDILLAVATCDAVTLDLTNLDEKYEDFTTSLTDFTIKIGEGAPPGWHQYFLCGVQGILDHVAASAGQKLTKGLKVTVSGTVPQSAGLSSSSALVSAAALAVSYANEILLSKEEIANICAQCERYIGTQGGGMDQAIAFLAKKGCAKLIEFNPLRSSDVLLPDGAVFVIAHSLTELNKASTDDYNCRVIECRLAAQMLAKRAGVEWGAVRKLGDLQKALGLDLEAMIALVVKNLHETPYRREQILSDLETTGDHLDHVSFTDNTRHLQSFKLRQRALHVFQEALRVEQFHDECRKAGNASSKKLGQLMSQSHESLRDLYECSHPQLDRLVETSNELALGARLTGAGWGGCMVALVAPELLDQFVQLLRDKFYKPLGIENHEKYVFATAPNAGACVYVNSS